jgi:hypothetical protein
MCSHTLPRERDRTSVALGRLEAAHPRVLLRGTARGLSRCVSCRTRQEARKNKSKILTTLFAGAALVLAGFTPAEARGGGGWHGRNAAIAAGIGAGLALAAAAAASGGPYYYGYGYGYPYGYYGGYGYPHRCFSSGAYC